VTTRAKPADHAEPRLRRATQSDGAAALGIVFSALAEYGLQPDPNGTDSDLRDIPSHYHARGGDFAVLEDHDGRVIGTCGLFRENDEVVELRKMYIAPPWRGRGQGQRLLDWAIKRARELGFRRIRLETASVLRDAIALYRKNGFRPDNGGIHTSRCDAAYVRDL
jgi:GNAT superfamily N-acetyltransferase